MFDVLTVVLGNVLGFVTDMFIVATTSKGLANQIRNFVAPLLLIACGIFAVTFLVQRQFMQMIIFVVIAILVFAIFYVPEMIGNLGKSVGQTNKSLTWK